ncbi:MAG: hypothetical protein E7070_02085 [Bacteroidales bacterium]|nr:hypothetical protein [Bacteroidales bacterium]
MNIRKINVAVVKKAFTYILMAVLGTCPMSGNPQQPVRRIFLEHANTISFDKNVNQERQVLRGAVLFRQDSVWMSCDSAYFYQSRNSFEAFSHVHMWEGDTLQMWCDSLSYDGETMIGQLFDNVLMRHNDTRLHTDYLIYYRQENRAHYPYNGWIDNPENHLQSDLGWYYTQSRQAIFQNNVVMRNFDFSKMSPKPAYPDVESEDYRPRMTLYSDTLEYSFLTDDAWIVGPSRIVNDTATLFSDLGTVNTKSQQSWLYNRSVVVSTGRSATADTLFYDGKAGYGDAWGNFVAYDTLQHLCVSGNRCHYVDSSQVMTVSDSALAMEFSTHDTLYLHADTLRAYKAARTRMVSVVREVVADSTIGQDSAAVTDSLPQREVKTVTERVAVTDTVNYLSCHFNVRYYRRDIQGVCDSLNYNHTDSLATFVGNPVMWNGNYQITGDSIMVYMAKEGGIDRALVHDNAFLVQQNDSIHFDQIAGKGLVCYFDSSRLSRMDMAGNVQTIFYPSEESKNGGKPELIGLNQVIGNYLSIWFKQQKMDHLRIWPQPVGSLTPIQLVTDDILYLRGFRWMQYLRPTSPADVFRDVRMKSEDQIEVLKLFDDRELNGW